MTKTYNIAIVGATGLVGNTLLSLLEARNFPIDKLFLLASQNSLGKTHSFKNTQYKIEDLAQFDFAQSDISFFCVGNELSAQYAKKAADCGNVVIDKSYFYRNHPDVPLIVPEVNLDAIRDFKKMRIIASPNCSTIPIAVALKPLYEACGITRINVCTYQSVSGTGKDAVVELMAQTRQILNNEEIKPQIYSQQIAFNILPHIDDFQDNGYTREEMKMVSELQKIFNDQTLAINPTAVRVPVLVGHAAAVHVETKSKINARDAAQLLSQSSGIKIFNGANPYPTPAKDAAGNDFVHIGRIREDISHEKGLNIWIVSDNLRKGAALNAIQIGEYLIEHYPSLQ